MLKLLKKLDKKDFINIVICVVLVFVQVWLELKMPDYMSSITRLVQTEGSKMSDIIEQGAYMLACALGSLISTIIVGYFAAHVASNFSKTVRGDIFKKVESFSTEEIKKLWIDITKIL